MQMGEAAVAAAQRPNETIPTEIKKDRAASVIGPSGAHPLLVAGGM
jgi:hypothetical protein